MFGNPKDIPGYEEVLRNLEELADDVHELRERIDDGDISYAKYCAMRVKALADDTLKRVARWREEVEL